MIQLKIYLRVTVVQNHENIDLPLYWSDISSEWVYLAGYHYERMDGNDWFCQGDYDHEEHWCLVGFGGIKKILVYELALEDRSEFSCK